MEIEKELINHKFTNGTSVDEGKFFQETETNVLRLRHKAWINENEKKPVTDRAGAKSFVSQKVKVTLQDGVQRGSITSSMHKTFWCSESALATEKTVARLCRCYFDRN